MNYNYNPFNVGISELHGSDLLVLKEVHEGWYIDYKSDTISIKDIAKHLSSFANQYGGWLFFGINEERTNKCAGEFSGIESSVVQELLVKIREAASAHVNPTPYYEEKVIDGPIDEIGLSRDKSIVVVCIAEGGIPPYVHSDGRIYRRLSDQSKPTPETDRGVLDLLWEKGEKNKNKLRKFLSFRPKITDVVHPVAFVYLITNPSFDKSFGPLSYEEFLEVVNPESGSSETLMMPMKTIHATSDGYVAKHSMLNNPHNVLPAIRWFYSGNALLTIPINSYNWNGGLAIENNRFKFDQEFCEELRSRGFQHGVVADLNYFLFVLGALYKQFSSLKEKSRNREKIYAHCVLENMRGIIPYIDDDTYIEQVKETGVPYLDEKEISVPNWYDTDIGLLPVKDLPTELEGEFRMYTPVVSVLGLMSYILSSVGIVNKDRDILKFNRLYIPPEIPKGIRE